MKRIKSETQGLRNDPVVVIETAERRKVEDGRIKKEKKGEKKKATSKQLHKSMALEKRASRGMLQGKNISGHQKKTEEPN